MAVVFVSFEARHLEKTFPLLLIEYCISFSESNGEIRSQSDNNKWLRKLQFKISGCPHPVLGLHWIRNKYEIVLITLPAFLVIYNLSIMA